MNYNLDLKSGTRYQNAFKNKKFYIPIKKFLKEYIKNKFNVELNITNLQIKDLIKMKIDGKHVDNNTILNKHVFGNFPSVELTFLDNKIKKLIDKKLIINLNKKKYINIPKVGKRLIRNQKNGKKYVIINKKKTYIYFL